MLGRNCHPCYGINSRPAAAPSKPSSHATIRKPCDTTQSSADRIPSPTSLHRSRRAMSPQRMPPQRPRLGPSLRVDQHHIPPALPRDRQGTQRDPTDASHRAHGVDRSNRTHSNRCPQHQATARQPSASPTPQPGRREHRPTGHRQPPASTATRTANCSHRPQGSPQTHTAPATPRIGRDSSHT
jgi:hypothetical protein